ncbi:hypothetical protein EJ08DRAFT_732030 [Tothia fuscella]|uniref:Uncharacterized protein n=1 Tax=Tothia fuscella TaxID=1048955 RepID=A0A9P4NXE6_9PEZI|nr:hypothetical protein EJ08DRAFT_732030 [Tothia fuscella]
MESETSGKLPSQTFQAFLQDLGRRLGATPPECLIAQGIATPPEGRYDSAGKVIEKAIIPVLEGQGLDGTVIMSKGIVRFEQNHLDAHVFPATSRGIRKATQYLPHSPREVLKLFVEKMLPAVHGKGGNTPQFFMTIMKPIVVKSVEEAISWASKHPGETGLVLVGDTALLAPGMFAIPILRDARGHTREDIAAGSIATAAQSGSGDVASASTLAVLLSNALGGMGQAIVYSAVDLTGVNTPSAGAADGSHADETQKQ